MSLVVSIKAILHCAVDVDDVHGLSYIQSAIHVLADRCVGRASPSHPSTRALRSHSSSGHRKRYDQDTWQRQAQAEPVDSGLPCRTHLGRTRSSGMPLCHERGPGLADTDWDRTGPGHRSLPSSLDYWERAKHVEHAREAKRRWLCCWREC